jgi:hypothetical protein
MFDLPGLAAWTASSEFWKDVFINLIGALFVGAFVLLRDRRKRLATDRYASAQLTNASRHLNEAMYVYTLWMVGIGLSQTSRINGSLAFSEKLLQLLTRTAAKPGRDMILRADALAAEVLGQFELVGWQLDPRARTAVSNIQEDLRLFRSVLRRVLLSYDRHQRVHFSPDHMPNFAVSIPALRKAALAYVIVDADRAVFTSGKALTIGALSEAAASSAGLTPKGQSDLLNEWGQAVPGAPNDRVVPQDWEADFNSRSIDLIFGSMFSPVSEKKPSELNFAAVFHSKVVPIHRQLDAIMTELSQDPLIGRQLEVGNLVKTYQLARDGTWDVQQSWGRAQAQPAQASGR